MWVVLGFPLAAAASVDGLSTGRVSDQASFVRSHTPHGCFLVQSLRRKRVKSGLPSGDFAVKGEGPAFGRGLVFCFLSAFNSSELSETKMPVLADLFLACRWLILSCLWSFGGWFFGR
jgi:hypothetical protein